MKLMKRRIPNLPSENQATLNLGHIRDMEAFKNAVITVMNTSGVTTGLGTHYNTKDEEAEARKNAVKTLFEMDRGVFMMIHALDGVTDMARKTAVKALLMNNREKYKASCLPRETETHGIWFMTRALQANRVLNMFAEMRRDRVNNSRTKRRLILPFLLNHPKLDWWAVKYRRKMREALEHAWDKRTTGVIRTILTKERTSEEEKGIRERIDRYLSAKTDRDKVYECISFILGNDGEFNLPLFKAFKEAKTDINKGNILPPEVLEGIRGTYHKNVVSQKKLLELTKATMTEKKKALVQRKAMKENVEIKFNPMARTPVELYILAYAEGMTPEIWDALMRKAREGARQLPLKFGKVGILVDDSFSMSGASAQKLRPMAVALAMKDVLMNTGETFLVKTASGRKIHRRNPLPRPAGKTDLASGLLDLLESGADAVFIISDGYENAPSGRVNEVMRLLTKIGHKTPIYHLNPVIGSESNTGLRTLSEGIPTLPAGNPQGLALTLMRTMFEVDIEKGIQALAAMTLPRITRDACLPFARSELTSSEAFN